MSGLLNIIFSAYGVIGELSLVFVLQPWDLPLYPLCSFNDGPTCACSVTRDKKCVEGRNDDHFLPFSASSLLYLCL